MSDTDAEERRPGRGGARDGAGRKKKDEQKKTAEQLVREQIEEELKSIRKVGMTTTLVREMALQSLATIFFHARNGNVRCAIWLANKLMEMPEPPIRDQVEEMASGDVAQNLEAMFLEMGLPPAISTGLTEFIQEGGGEEGGHTADTLRKFFLAFKVPENVVDALVRVTLEHQAAQQHEPRAPAALPAQT